MPVSLPTSFFSAVTPLTSWVSGSLPLLKLYTAFRRWPLPLRLVLIMVSRGRLMPWTVFALLSKVISSMVSVLPPPAVS